MHNRKLNIRKISGIQNREHFDIGYPKRMKWVGLVARMGEISKTLQLESLKGRDRSENVCAEGRIILK
jgi:hypothetical protein